MSTSSRSTGRDKVGLKRLVGSVASSARERFGAGDSDGGHGGSSMLSREGLGAAWGVENGVRKGRRRDEVAGV